MFQGAGTKSSSIKAYLRESAGKQLILAGDCQSGDQAGTLLENMQVPLLSKSMQHIPISCHT